MISNACTRIDMGASAGSLPNPDPSAHPSLTCGDREDVIQVSITSGSGTSSPPPHDGHELTGGESASGSTGRAPSPGSTRAQQAAPNHTRDGTPERRRPGMVPAPLSPSVPASTPPRLDRG